MRGSELGSRADRRQTGTGAPIDEDIRSNFLFARDPGPIPMGTTPRQRQTLLRTASTFGSKPCVWSKGILYPSES